MSKQNDPQSSPPSSPEVPEESEFDHNPKYRADDFFAETSSESEDEEEVLPRKVAKPGLFADSKDKRKPQEEESHQLTNDTPPGGLALDNNK